MISDPDALLAALDPEQRDVSTTLNGPVVVIAGAGTGKTRAITHRIAYGVRTGAYNPVTVLAVTFTTRAAGEMRGRLQRLGVRGVQARTFHSAALRQAQYFWPRVHGAELPGVLDNRMALVAEAAGRLRVPVDTATLRDLVGEISWAKVSNVIPADYPAIAANSGRELASATPEVVARVFSGYEEAKRSRGRIDFEDILLCTTALLSDHPEIADEVRRTYRHFVVDEYQDVSPLQQALLELWVGERRDLCVVGDPAQTIHSFAGARADFLTGFARRDPGTTVIRLVRDYRSTPQVVEVANAIMRRAEREGGGARGAITAVTLQAQRPPGPAPAFAEAPDEAAEAAGVADWLAARHAEGVEYREMAVLFRINAQSPAFEQALADRDIPYLVRGAERFYERREVRLGLSVLRAAVRTGALEDGPVGEQVRTLLETTGWTREAPTGGGQRRERWESLAALASVADDVAAADPTVTLIGVVAELERRAEAQHAPMAQGVTVATIHAAKGLEWDAVAVVGVQEGTLPFVLATAPAQIAEERRLLYVAVTRAREHLRVSWSRTRSGSGNRNPSRFLQGVRPDSPVATAAPARSRRRGSTQTARCRVCGRGLTNAAERKLGRHENCPASYDEDVLSALRTWRSEQAREEKLPAYCIFTDATLQALAESVPTDEPGLLAVSGIGRTKADKYGASVLGIIRRT